MWGCGDINKHPEYMNLKDMRMCGQENTNKHTEYMNLRKRECEDTRLQASTHEPEDMRMQGCKWGHINLRIWGCKYARTQIGTHEHKDISAQESKDMRIWGCGDINKSNISNMLVTSRLRVGYYNLLHTSLHTLICLMVYRYLIIFWCTIHQTLPHF